MNLDQWAINKLAELAVNGDRIVGMLYGIFIILCAVSILLVIGIGIVLDKLDRIAALLKTSQIHQGPGR